MYFLNINKLKKQLILGDLTKQENRRYFLGNLIVFLAIDVIVRSLLLNSDKYFLAYNLGFPLLYLLSLLFVYIANGKDKEVNILAKLVGINFIFTNYFALLTLALGVLLTPVIQNKSLIVLSSFTFVFLFYLGFMYYFVKDIQIKKSLLQFH